MAVRAGGTRDGRTSKCQKHDKIGQKLCLSRAENSRDSNEFPVGQKSPAPQFRTVLAEPVEWDGAEGAAGGMKRPPMAYVGPWTCLRASGEVQGAIEALEALGYESNFATQMKLNM